MNDFKDKVVVVTGGARGIGKCIAEEFEKEGAKVYVIDEEIAKEMKKYDGKFYTCHCTGPKAYQKLKSEMKDKLEYLAVGMTVEK